MFVFKKKQTPAPTLEDLLAQAPVFNLTHSYVARDTEYRPCWVRGKKAIFHRWENTARPQLPRGEQPSETARYYQYRCTKAIVEYEDGTVDRVWPTDIQFADGDLFREREWREDTKHAAE